MDGKRKGISSGTLLIIILGIVSLFADFVYEGGRSVIPQFFTTVLGGSVFLLGIVLGVGEFLGYSVRLISGKFADKTRSYWGLMGLGYAINMLALPLLAFTGSYLLAAILIVLERVGKGIRAPPKDYVVSTAASSGKVGRAFAINEALDQTGAVVGPLVMALIILAKNNYRFAFEFLFLPAVLAFATLAIAYKFHKKLPKNRQQESRASPMSSTRFLFYSAAVAISAAGLYNVSFVLVGAQGHISMYLIPLIFMTAMIGEGFFGTVFGLLYDKVGKNLVYAGLAATAVIPFVLLGRAPALLFISALVFGAAIGIQDTVMKSVVGSLIPESKRGSAYGIFNSLYGFGLMAAGIVVGYLYYTIGAIIVYVIATQIVAFLLLYLSFREKKTYGNAVTAQI
jgi:MFS family permease